MPEELCILNARLNLNVTENASCIRIFLDVEFSQSLPGCHEICAVSDKIP